jgi:predicted membrane protein
METRTVLRVASCVWAVFTMPCLFFSCLGFSDHLSDTSVEENTKQGLCFLGIWGIAVSPAVIVFLLSFVPSRGERLK